MYIFHFNTIKKNKKKNTIENRKFNFYPDSHLQYYKIDFCFSVELREINLKLYEQILILHKEIQVYNFC